MKRFLAAFLTLVLLLTSLTVIATADADEWVEWSEDGGCYLWNNKGKVEFTGWHKVTQTWTSDDGYTDSWTNWFYSEANGKLVEGWKQIEGTWYYFWPEMVTGSWYDWNKKTAYLFNENGAWTGVSATKAGWVKQGSDWYYAQDEETDWWDDEVTYHTEKYQSFLYNGIYEIDGKLYYFDKNGKMAAGKWIAPYKDEQWAKHYNYQYYLRFWAYANADGTLAQGWKKIDGNWYYFEEENGRMKDMGAAFIDGTRYVFEYTSGRMLTSGWIHDTWIDYWGSEEVVSDEWLYLNADGTVKTGWLKDGGKWYYLEENEGWGTMYHWGFAEIGGKIYYFDEDAGFMYQNKWYGFETDWGDEGIQTDWYYFGDDGAMATGWFQAGSNWYYADDWGTVMLGIMEIDGKLYYLDPVSYALKTGWIKDGDIWYYGKADGSLAVAETIKINGKDYTFDTDGAWVE